MRVYDRNWWLQPNWVKEKYNCLEFIGDKSTLIREDCDVKCPLRMYLESVGAIATRNKRMQKQIEKTL